MPRTKTKSKRPRNRSNTRRNMNLIVASSTTESEASTDTINVMTWNVEVLLNIYNYHDLSDATADGYELDATKKSAFDSIFNGIDVACLQEVASKEDSNEVLINLTDPLHIPEMKLANVKQATELTWTVCKKIYGEQSHLANAVYVKSGATFSGGDPFLSGASFEKRAYATAVYKGVKVVSTHLPGGRFEDQIVLNSILTDGDSQGLRNKKKEMIESIIDDQQPDIICGDMNSTTEETPIMPYMIHVLEQIRENRDVDLPFHPSAVEKWTEWMKGLDNFMRTRGYQSAMVRLGDDTSAYGGTVERIYYLPDKLQLVGGKATVLNSEDIMRRETPTYNASMKYTPVLSDHFPVVAKFKILP